VVQRGPPPGRHLAQPPPSPATQLPWRPPPTPSSSLPTPASRWPPCWPPYAYNRGDWTAFGALAHPGCVIVDHRTGGWGTLGRDEYVAYQRQLAELAPDARLWIDHLTVEDGVGLNLSRSVGTADGGSWEREVVGVGFSARDQNLVIDVYDLDDLAAALARRDELLRLGPTAHPPG
jgi:hypothetical protein